MTQKQNERGPFYDDVFVNKVLDLQKRKNLDQKEIATLLKRGKSYFNRIVNGHLPVTRQVSAALEKLLVETEQAQRPAMAQPLPQDFQIQSFQYIMDRFAAMTANLEMLNKLMDAEIKKNEIVRLEDRDFKKKVLEFLERMEKIEEQLLRRKAS